MRLPMHCLLALVAFWVSIAAQARTIADEFAAGFGGVYWGMNLDELIDKFPGGFESFAVSSGGLSYTVNIEDPVLGIERPALYVIFGIDPKRSVESIGIQNPPDQAQPLIDRLTLQFGPALRPESLPLELVYAWPTDGDLRLTVRLSRGGAHRLAIVGIFKRPRVPPAKAKSRN